ncbi:hypothetical protein AC579_8756 [Pseudocercospora musae]|uniref:Alpha-1,3-glucosyltransferase n=1 Tax=Pseudocercospora musae TaxID=113226 RepID=A0A139IWN1_9PEZI|nr:hypothetical protein AC579_8756 [Pseudocercospora musae]
MGQVGALDRSSRPHTPNARRKATYPQLAKPAQRCQPANRWTSISKLLAVGFSLRIFAACLSHSGQGKAPMYGDFEAQRHWMEITTRLPVSQWYFHDAEWWRLDYPPLTAYHSWILGKIGSMANASWFDLYTSRGCEELGLKAFMRTTVFASELLIFVPAVYLAVSQLAQLRVGKMSARHTQIALVALLLQPAMILVDHGHFQYNTVMLGLFLAAMGSFLADYHLAGCLLFVGALGFKQMALFYAPAVAAYLAGTCFVPTVRPFRLVAIAAVTTASFAALYAPLLFGTWYDIAHKLQLPPATTGGPRLLLLFGALPADFQPFAIQIAQSIHRMFPFSRGLFEDKVANIWCSIHFSGVYKLAKHHSPETLSLAALALTMFLILPPCLVIFFRPRKSLVTLAFTTCAWGFFLCSYQVHEKNVLLPLVPMTALLAGEQGARAATRAWVGFANIVASWTLYHLLIKDDLQVAYLPLLGVWLYAMDMPPFSFKIYQKSSEHGGPSRLSKCVHLSAYAATATWHLVEAFIPPPASKPDLWIVANMILGCMAFFSCYLWCLAALIAESGFAGDVRTLLKSCSQGPQSFWYHAFRSVSIIR